MRVKAGASARNGIPCGLDAAWLTELGTKDIQITGMSLGLDQPSLPVLWVKSLARVHHRPRNLQ